MPVTCRRSSTNKHRNQKQQKPISETDPMYSIVPATRSKKSTISSLLLTPFSPTTPNHDRPTTPIAKKKKFSSFRGLGCTETSQVSVPAAIADWESKKVKKKKRKKQQQQKIKTLNFVGGDSSFFTHNTCCRKTRHSWMAASVDDFVVSTRPLSSRGRVDLDNITPREIVMLQNSLMGGRTDGLDQYRSLRLNVDNMSYEELLELGDRIGYVSTGLKEDEITQCVRRTKPFFLNHLSHLCTELEKKCSICQEEYEAEDEMGKLGCGHLYHIHCIKQWLMHKNSCPVCKSAAMSDS